MDFKAIQDKLKNLRDRIRKEGRISEDNEQELKLLLHETLMSATDELNGLQGKLETLASQKIGNDNVSPLSEDQSARLSLIQKTGTGSASIH
ncbi:MAG: hypothetical protein H6853_05045 [Rhodospirillales bacterium]|nr:hypothetical protein [Alphaproteobacteria bacterium]USO02919.1 MAG: hypothetical protein H6853_05045 [Rhodospirillales bacterium]